MDTISWNRWKGCCGCQRQAADNARENKNRLLHVYKKGDLVFLIDNDVKRKLKCHIGPFKVMTVHSNGTVTIQRSARVKERVNIRRLHPGS